MAAGCNNGDGTLIEFMTSNSDWSCRWIAYFQHSSDTDTSDTRVKILRFFISNVWVRMFRQVHVLPMATNEAPIEWIPVPKGMLSRLLYANPVCVLATTYRKDGLECSNLMTISWLTCTDNHGHFMLSMNKNRFTHEILQSQDMFVLNVMSLKHKDRLLQIGGCSGRNCTPDKPTQLSIEMCTVRLQSSKSGDDVALLGLTDCVSHIVCRIAERLERQGHTIMFCTMEMAIVDSRYWTDKQLIAPRDLPPLLSFLGTKMFASINQLDD